MVRRTGEEGFKQREQQRHLKRADQLAADAALAVFGKVPLGSVVRQHLEGDDTGDRKHHGQLPAHADQQDERRGLIADRPQRIACEVPDCSVCENGL